MSLGMVSKGLEKRLGELEIGGRLETNNTTTLLNTEKRCSYSDSNDKLEANCGMKNSQREKY